MDKEISIIGNLNKRIKKLREKYGYKTQQAFADALHVDRSVVKSWEREGTEKTKPSLPGLDNLLLMSELFDCDLDFLIGRLEEPTHDIQFIHDQTGLTGEAVKKLQGNPGLMFVLSLLIEQKDFDLWLQRISDYFKDLLLNHMFPPETEEDTKDEIDDRDQKGILICMSLIRMLEAIPIREYETRLNEALKNINLKGDDMD